MTIRVGRWDCESCGHIGNIGHETRCSQCGSPRPKNVRFYLPEDAETVTDTELIKKAKAGADWVCSYCNAHNKADVGICASCGNDRNETDGDENLERKEYRLGEIPTDGKQKIVTAPVKKPSSGKFKYILGGIVMIIATFIILSMFQSDTQVEVTGFEWKISHEPEYHRLVTEENWNAPQDAQNIERFKAIHHYDKIPDGFETKIRTVKKQVGTKKEKTGTIDLGNGMFEDVYEDVPVYKNVEEKYKVERFREEPVYRDKYRYKVLRWVRGQPFVAAGNDHQPIDPVINTTEEFRIKYKDEHYYILVKDQKGETHKEEVSKQFWQQTQVGQNIKAVESSVFNTYKGLKESVF